MAALLSTTPSITLTPAEERLAQLLVECAAWIDDNPAEVDNLRLKDPNGAWIGKERGTEKVELRIAGGWVRDRLLGKQSDDIDVSTSPDPITGLKFATLFETYLKRSGQPDLMGRLTKIEAKPEQSKHLETATAVVCGLSIDWVQQRGTEIYTADSRIPTVSFGTPLEDACRRDLTINALFYNLHSQQIEDQTGLGLQDLGLVPGFEPRIRTPLQPFETFHDDPLRVVRAVRFAARFGRAFKLDEELVETIGREEIRAALRDPKKISRERVGVELEKMLLGNDPLYAMELIERLGLHPLIFLSFPTVQAFTTDPATPAPPPITSDTILASRILADLLSLPSTTPSHLRASLHPLLSLSLPPTSASASASPSEALTTISHNTIRRLFLSAGLYPLYDMHTLEKGKPVWLGGHVLMEGIKGTGADKKWTDNARKASCVLSSGVKEFGGVGRSGEEARAEERGAIGMLLKDVAVHDPFQDARWNVSLLWSLVVDLVRLNGNESESLALVESYNRFVSLILSLGLDTSAFEPSLLDGKEILEALPHAKGPAMTDIKESVFRWQFEHPGRTKDECRAWLTGDEARGMVAEAIERAKRPRVNPVGVLPGKKKKGRGAGQGV